MTRRRQAYLLLREVGIAALMVGRAASESPPLGGGEEALGSHDKAFDEVRNRFKAIWRGEEPLAFNMEQSGGSQTAMKREATIRELALVSATQRSLMTQPSPECEDNAVYIQAWVWGAFADTEIDKLKESL